jgi:ribosomal RNA-processing protein 7
VNAHLSHYAHLESLRNAQLSRQRNVPDDDGFITVARGGRTGAGRIEDAQAAQARLKERREKKAKEAGDFYRFQSREERKKKEGELKRRFEEERRRVGEMREKRGRVVPEA